MADEFTNRIKYPFLKKIIMNSKLIWGKINAEFIYYLSDKDYKYCLKKLEELKHLNYFF